MSKSSFLLYICLALLLFSCDKDDNDTSSNQQPTDTSIHPTALTINFSELGLFPGTNQQLTVEFTPSNTTNKKLTWTSSNISVASVDTNGVVKAIAAGTANITATSVDRVSVKVSSTVTVLKN